MRFYVIREVELEQQKPDEQKKPKPRKRHALATQMGGAVRARYRPMSTIKFLKSMAR